MTEFKQYIFFFFSKTVYQIWVLLCVKDALETNM